jgi:predicted Fe-Mo cluster-binding NifX family protein
VVFDRDKFNSQTDFFLPDDLFSPVCSLKNPQCTHNNSPGKKIYVSAQGQQQTLSAFLEKSPPPLYEQGARNPVAALRARAVDVVVTGGMGARAIMMLNQTGIKVFRAIPETVDTIIGTFGVHDLEELTVKNASASHDYH